MKKAFLAFSLLCCAMLAPMAMDGHHGYSAFDTRTVVTFQATVTEFHFTNPHSVIEFEAAVNGETQKWQAELGSRIQLTLHGWKPTTIEPGSKLTVSGYPAKNGAKSLWATKILDADGKEIRITREN